MPSWSSAFPGKILLPDSPYGARVALHSAFADDDVAGADAAVELSIAGLPSAGTPLKLVHHRVDEQHSNAYTLWKSLGSPTAPSRGQYAQLEAASQLATLTGAPGTIVVENGSAKLKFPLPRQAVSLLVVSW